MTADHSTSSRKWNKKAISFAVSLVAALGITFLLQDASFTQSQTYVLFLLLFSVRLWLTEAVPPFARIGGTLVGLLGPAIIVLWVLSIT